MRTLKRNYQFSLVFRTIFYEYMSHPLNTEITPNNKYSYVTQNTSRSTGYCCSRQ